MSTAFAQSPFWQSSSDTGSQTVVIDTNNETTSAAAVDEDGPQGDSVKAVENVSPPAKGAEVRNTFGELVGWLDLDLTLAP